MEIKQAYNTIAKQFSQTRTLLWKELYVFLPYLQPGMRILDAGCGNGRLLSLFENISVEYIGVDQSEKLLSEARTKHPGKTFVIDSMPELQNVSGQFDAIFCIAAFHHLENRTQRERCLNRMYQLLKPGGYLFMTNWNLFQLKYLSMSIEQSFKNIIAGNTWNDFLVPFTIHKNGETQKIQRMYHGFTKWEIDGYIKRSKFKPIESYYALKGRKCKSPWVTHNIITIAQKI